MKFEIQKKKIRNSKSDFHQPDCTASQIDQIFKLMFFFKIENANTDMIHIRQLSYICTDASVKFLMKYVSFPKYSLTNI